MLSVKHYFRPVTITTFHFALLREAKKMFARWQGQTASRGKKKKVSPNGAT